MKLVNTTANIKISTTDLFIANSMMLTEPPFSSYQKLDHRLSAFQIIFPQSACFFVSAIQMTQSLFFFSAQVQDG